VQKGDLRFVEKYLTKESLKVWVNLFDILFEKQKKYACKEWLDGMDELRIHHEYPPTIHDMNGKLKGPIKLTLVEPHLYGKRWFNNLAVNLYNISNEMRPFKELENAKRPDAYHDYIGHAPLLINEKVVDAMCDFASRWALATENQRKILTKIWFFMMEFGTFYRQNDQKLRVFGGGIVTSMKQLNIIEEVNQLIDSRILYNSRGNSFFPIINSNNSVIQRYSYDKLIENNIDKNGLPDVMFVFEDMDHMLNEFLCACEFALTAD